MRLGLATSTALHGGLLAWGLLSISAPEPLETADVEALPVEIVSAAEFAQIVKGAEEAPKQDAPAPEPTLREAAEPDAVEIGEAEVDVAVAPAPVVLDVPVEAPQPDAAPVPDPNQFDIADVPQPSDRPEPARQETVEIADASEPPAPVQPAPEADAPAPPTEVAEVPPEPIREPTPAPITEEMADAVAAAIDAAATEADAPAEKAETAPAQPQFASLPTNAPKALFRPARPNRAQTTERRKEAVAAASTPKEQGERRVADEIAALLNREKPSGGGAAASVTPASLGGSRTNATTLSNSEMDMLRRAIGRCWNPPAGVMNAGELVVKVSMKLDRAGEVIGRPTIVEKAGGRTGQIAAEAAVRAMRRCAPYTDLPADKFETWSEVVVNFDPRDMF